MPSGHRAFNPRCERGAEHTGIRPARKSFLCLTNRRRHGVVARSGVVFIAAGITALVEQALERGKGAVALFGTSFRTQFGVRGAGLTLVVMSLSAFITMNFTGSSTFTEIAATIPSRTSAGS